MKNIKYVLLLCAMLLLIAGCSNGNSNASEKGGELRVAISSEPPTLDTHLATTNVASNLARNVFETLLTLDTKGGVHPMLAETYEILEDGKVIEFKLRQGVKFHNGEEFKAADVVASMNRWIQFLVQEKKHSKEQFSTKLTTILFNW